MTRERLLMLVGMLVLISPWSGFPLSWLQWILPALGLATIALAVTMRSRNPANGTPSAPEVVPASHSKVPESRSSHIAFS